MSQVMRVKATFNNLRFHLKKGKRQEKKIKEKLYNYNKRKIHEFLRDKKFSFLRFIYRNNFMPISAF